jgi:hypothetical protein
MNNDTALRSHANSSDFDDGASHASPGVAPDERKSFKNAAPADSLLERIGDYNVLTPLVIWACLFAAVWFGR